MDDYESLKQNFVKTSGKRPPSEEGFISKRELLNEKAANEEANNKNMEYFANIMDSMSKTMQTAMQTVQNSQNSQPQGMQAGQMMELFGMFNEFKNVIQQKDHEIEELKNLVTQSISNKTTDINTSEMDDDETSGVEYNHELINENAQEQESMIPRENIDTREHAGAQESDVLQEEMSTPEDEVPQIISENPDEDIMESSQDEINNPEINQELTPEEESAREQDFADAEREAISYESDSFITDIHQVSDDDLINNDLDNSPHMIGVSGQNAEPHPEDSEPESETESETETETETEIETESPLYGNPAYLDDMQDPMDAVSSTPMDVKIIGPELGAAGVKALAAPKTEESVKKLLFSDDKEYCDTKTTSVPVHLGFINYFRDVFGVKCTSNANAINAFIYYALGEPPDINVPDIIRDLAKQYNGIFRNQGNSSPEENSLEGMLKAQTANLGAISNQLRKIMAVEHSSQFMTAWFAARSLGYLDEHDKDKPESVDLISGMARLDTSDLMKKLLNKMSFFTSEYLRAKEIEDGRK